MKVRIEGCFVFDRPDGLSKDSVATDLLSALVGEGLEIAEDERWRVAGIWCAGWEAGQQQISEGLTELPKDKWLQNFLDEEFGE